MGGNTVTTVKYDDQYSVTAGVENAGGSICNPPPFGEITCPTGTITLKDGGVSLGNSPYTLDGAGFIQTVTLWNWLTGGTHNLTAEYAGDANYNAGSKSVTITVNPAATSMPAPYLYNATVAEESSITASVSTTSYGIAPTGTITFYANGKVLGGISSYSPGNGFAPYYYASMVDYFTSNTNSFPTPGNYAITASYSGDANYGSSTSAVTNINVLYPQPSTTITPPSQNLAYGGTANLTALVSSGKKKVYPSGTITFVDSGTGQTLSGPTTCTSTTDSSGNFACQAAASYTVTDGYGIWANYSGDSNYPSATGYAVVGMQDFYEDVNPAQFTLTAGQSQNIILNIGSLSSFAGTVSNFACSGLPAESTCTFNPAQLTADPNQWVSTTLTITTTALGQSRRRTGAAKIATALLSVAGMFLVGACLIGFSTPRRRGLAVGLMALAIMLTLPSCGGGNTGGGGGGGGGGNPNPTPHITSLSPSQVAIGSQINNLTVTGTNFMSTSTLTLGGVAAGGYVSSTQMLVYPSSSQLATAGQLPVVVTNPTPGGGPSNAVNFDVTTGTPTGNFNIAITATGGGLTRTAPLYLTVQ